MQVIHTMINITVTKTKTDITITDISRTLVLPLLFVGDSIYSTKISILKINECILTANL